MNYTVHEEVWWGFGVLGFWGFGVSLAHESWLNMAIG